MHNSIPFDNLGKHNSYKCCACKCVIVTVDRDVGVTPFQISCENCETGSMVSGFYNEAFADFEPTHEWYKPDAKELARLGTDMHSWVLAGYLLLRSLGEAPLEDFEEPDAS